MSITQSSRICRFFLAMWAVLTGAWANSAFCRGLDRLGRWGMRALRESVVFQFLWRDGAVTRSWETSLTCRVLAAVVNIPCALCKTIYKWGKELIEGSLACRVISALGGAAFLFTGLFLAVMLVVPHESWNNLYALAAVVVLTGLFAMGSASRPAFRLETERLGPHFVLYLGMVCMAFLTSLSWSDSLRFVGFYLTFFLLILLTVSAIHSYEQLQLMVALAVAGLTVAALYGCYQAVIGVEIIPSQQDMVVNAGMPGRIYSFFDNPNNFAELLVMLTPFTFALFLNAEGWRGRVLALFSFAVCAVALACTYSRSGWLGIALAVVVFLAFENWKLIPVLGLAGLCCVPLLPRTIYNRLLTIGNTNDSSTNYRFAIYKASAELMKDHWLKGVGLGSDVLTRAFRCYPPMFDGSFPIHTHNNYLQVWAETGLFGLITFLATLGYTLKQAVKHFRSAVDPRLRRLLAAAAAGFCGILLISVAEYTWFYPRNMFFYWFLFGVLAAGGKLAHRSVRSCQA